MNEQISRIDAILAEAKSQGRITVDEMVSALDVSAHTVRRDINALCEQGKLRRLHGGAEYVDELQNLPYPVRSGLNLQKKRLIASQVAQMIPDGVTLFFSIGTTPALVAGALAERSNLTVVTCNLNVAMALSSAPNARIILPRGEVRLPDYDILSHDAITLFQEYRADFAIYGVGGIDDDGSLLDFHPEEVKLREAARVNARQSILVADRSKFGRRAASIGGVLSDADQVVIDAMPESGFEGVIEAVSDKLTIVEQAQ